MFGYSPDSPMGTLPSKSVSECPTGSWPATAGARRVGPPGPSAAMLPASSSTAPPRPAEGGGSTRHGSGERLPAIVAPKPLVRTSGSARRASTAGALDALRSPRGFASSRSRVATAPTPWEWAISQEEPPPAASEWAVTRELPARARPPPTKARSPQVTVTCPLNRGNEGQVAVTCGDLEGGDPEGMTAVRRRRARPGWWGARGRGCPPRRRVRRAAAGPRPRRPAQAAGGSW